MPNSRLSVAQAVEDRGAQRGVDHRDRLVGDDQPRPEQQRARHHDALPLAAAELVRDSAPASPRDAARPPERLLDQCCASGLRDLARPNF